MKKILILAGCALIAALGGLFLSAPEARVVVVASPAPSAQRAPAAAAAPMAPGPGANAPASLAKAIRATKECYESQSCDYPQTDPRSYSFALGRHLAAQLGSLSAALDANPSLAEEAGEVAREMMLVDDGFVQEAAMRILAKLPASAESAGAMIEGLRLTSDPLLVEQAMKEWERYLGTAEEAKIQEFLAEFIAHGGQFSAEKASELILSFLNERSLPLFEEKLASMVPESTAASHLRAALDQFRKQQAGG